jgi:hypothetical protein
MGNEAPRSILEDEQPHFFLLLDRPKVPFRVLARRQFPSSLSIPFAASSQYDFGLFVGKIFVSRSAIKCHRYGADAPVLAVFSFDEIATLLRLRPSASFRDAFSANSNFHVVLAVA